MKTYTAIKYSGGHRPIMAQSSSSKRLYAWLRENGGQYIGATELRGLRRKWRDSGGQPSVVIDLDKEVTK